MFKICLVIVLVISQLSASGYLLSSSNEDNLCHCEEKSTKKKEAVYVYRLKDNKESGEELDITDGNKNVLQQGLDSSGYFENLPGSKIPGCAEDSNLDSSHNNTAYEECDAEIHSYDSIYNMYRESYMNIPDYNLRSYFLRRISEVDEISDKENIPMKAW